MGFNGSEIQHNVTQISDWYTGYEADTCRTLVKTSTHWIVAHIEGYLTGEFWYYKIVIHKSVDGITWEDMNFPVPVNSDYAGVNIAVGADDSLHVVVINNATWLSCYYSKYSLDVWSTPEEIVTGEIDIAVYLALDSNNYPHISYTLASGGSMYTNRVLGGWIEPEELSSTLKVTNMSISPLDIVHLVLYSLATSYAWYINGTSGDWNSPEEIDDHVINFADITCNGELPVVVITGTGYVRIYTKDGTWSETDINLAGKSSNRVSIASGAGNIYLAWEVTYTPMYNDHQWFYSDNVLGSYSTPINITHTDMGGDWLAGTLWTNTVDFGFSTYCIDGDGLGTVGFWGNNNPVANMWGFLELNLYEYVRTDIEQFGDEKGIIPYTRLSIAQARLIRSGRGRERRNVRGWAEKVDFDALEQDCDAYTKKLVTFHDGTQITLAIIESLEGERKKGTTIVWYSAVFLEVDL